ncbi:hypothetical protein DEO72_LG5g1707 [Vigna unguiculata]|uniref:Uncharacterized protein n=1 Tax=Vigna unguiculata TaxID=3917 RepID=A0A4D6LZ52_VIGUN|nr:hypothetical protein DEO72_LG5g1707 [Vigna unguiculata]
MAAAVRPPSFSPTATACTTSPLQQLLQPFGHHSSRPFSPQRTSHGHYTYYSNNANHHHDGVQQRPMAVEARPLLHEPSTFSTTAVKSFNHQRTTSTQPCPQNLHHKTASKAATIVLHHYAHLNPKRRPSSSHNESDLHAPRTTSSIAGKRTGNSEPPPSWTTTPSAMETQQPSRETYLHYVAETLIWEREGAAMCHTLNGH